MNREQIHQVTTRDEKRVPAKERIKISTTNVRVETTVPQKEDTFQVIIDVSGTNSYEFLFANKKCLVDAQVFWKILDICARVKGVDFAKVPDDETTLTFLLDLGYKGLLHKHPSMQLKKGRHKSMPFPRKQTSSRRIKKKVIISAAGNMIHELDIALKLQKSISLTEVAKEEAARQVHATHARIMTESVLEQTRRRPLGIAFRDTSSVTKKLSHDPSWKLKGVQTLTPEEQLVAETIQALKESKKTSRRQQGTRGSSKGTGVSPGVLGESIVVLATSSEGTGTKPGLSDEEKVTSEANVILEWGSEQENEYSKEEDDDENVEWVDTEDEEQKNDDDDDKIIDLEKTDDEFVHNAEINYLLDVQIQQEIPNIQSPSILNVSISVIFKPSILTPIPETPSVSPATTLLPPPFVSIIPHVQQLSITPILTPPITTEAPKITTIPDPLHVVIQRRHTEELIQKYPQQINYKEMIEESVQANIINKVKNQLPMLLPKIDKSHSYLTLDKHQDLYDALFNSLSLDDVIASGQADLEKVLRKRDGDDKDPSARPNQGTKTKRRRTKESEPSKKSSTFKESSKAIFEMASDDIEQTIDDAVNDANQPHDDSTQSKDTYSKIDWLKQPLRPPTPNQDWNKHQVKILSVKSVGVKKLRGYGYLEEIMNNQFSFRIQQGDVKEKVEGYRKKEVGAYGRTY
nr:hypothetical protein [Tanacetum cinerariifolium]